MVKKEVIATVDNQANREKEAGFRLCPLPLNKPKSLLSLIPFESNPSTE
jgi:hypothetical protein